MGARLSSAGSVPSEGGLRQISPTKRKRALSEDNWDFEFASLDEQNVNPSFTADISCCGPLAWPTPQSHPPVYILEASLSDQELWYSTAGQRPAQPAEERKHFEELYKSNFENSEALKGRNIFDDACIERACRTRRDTKEDVVFRGKGPFSYAVSKSFVHCSPPCMTLQVMNLIFFFLRKAVLNIGPYTDS